MIPSWEQLFDQYVKNLLENRPNPYDIEHTAVRLGCSIDDATNAVNHLKTLTRGTLETFIRKYGAEEGTKRFKHKQQISKSSKENFISRYGECDGEIKWQQYMKSRNTRSLESYISRHGEQKGRDLYESTVNNWTAQMSRDGYIKRYGELEGLRLYQKILMRKSGIYRFFDAQDPTTASEKYENALRDHTSAYWKSPEWNKAQARLSLRGRTNKAPSSTSLQANSFFVELEQRLGHDLRYGARRRELQLCDVNGSIYYYDCYDPHTNTIIEFNGSRWHYREGNKCRVWQTASDELKKISELRDELKKTVAISQGHNYIVVWDTDISGKLKRINTIDSVIQQLTEFVNNKEKE